MYRARIKKLYYFSNFLQETKKIPKSRTYGIDMYNINY
jgi:hypothetical protein